MAVILVFALQKGVLSRILSNKVLIWGGEVSYGIYLVQLLVINTIARHSAELSATNGAIVAITASIFISYISFKYYEKPMNRIVKRWLGYKKRN